MRHLLIAVSIVFIAATSEAGYRGFCTRMIARIVEEDPAPFAEYSNEELVEWYRLSEHADLKKEISFRLRARMILPSMLGNVFYDFIDDEGQLKK